MCLTMGIPRRTAKTRTAKTVKEAERSRGGMHVCPDCSSGLVQPVRWFEQGGGRWFVELHCPECEWHGDGAFSQDEVDAYDTELDRGGQELLADLRSLTKTIMEEEAERLATALAADVILPEDF